MLIHVQQQQQLCWRWRAGGRAPETCSGVPLQVRTCGGVESAGRVAESSVHSRELRRASSWTARAKAASIGETEAGRTSVHRWGVVRASRSHSLCKHAGSWPEVAGGRRQACGVFLSGGDPGRRSTRAAGSACFLLYRHGRCTRLTRLRARLGSASSSWRLESVHSPCILPSMLESAVFPYSYSLLRFSRLLAHPSYPSFLHMSRAFSLTRS